ncbi:MAG: hypothetical protein IJF35_03350 [Clostridia bacterium]|nr:hypothetical protein [Clostridia bacterium]
MCVRENKYGISEYNPPKKLMTASEYRTRMDELANMPSKTSVGNEFYDKLENLRNDLYDMITYNTDEVSPEGNVYYISNVGDDNADGKSPNTAWRTLEKVNSVNLAGGDAVLLRRGDMWRENLILKSGVTFSAYGVGPKPQIRLAYDGKNDAKWLKTDMENIWVFDKVLDDKDIGLVLFNNGEFYAERKYTFATLTEDFSYMFCNEFCFEEENVWDNKVYVYCSKGNPADVFEQVDISRHGSTIQLPGLSHDILVKNIETFFGQDYFFAGSTKNIRIEYCTFAWAGGTALKRSTGERVRFGGGGGSWHSCDGMIMDHCYFTQHFDTAVTPQYNWHEEEPAIFKDYRVQDCLIEYTEYSFEYFNSQSNHDDNCFDGLYFGYNFCRLGGKGFGDKKSGSRYIKSWRHENVCYNSLFENNIFDRAESLSIEVISHAPGKSFDEVSYDYLPKMRKNIYIEPKDKDFANINCITYKYNEASFITLQKLGIEDDPVYLFAE